MRFAKQELDAGKVAGSAEGNVSDRAAWTVVARVLLNLDETITKELTNESRGQFTHGMRRQVV